MYSCKWSLSVGYFNTGNLHVGDVSDQFQYHTSRNKRLLINVLEIQIQSSITQRTRLLFQT